MSINAIYKTGVAIMSVAVLLAGCASPKTQQDAQTSVKEAEATLARFQSDPDMKWLQAHIKDAKAIMISPKVLEAGFIVGGSGGPAVVIARTNTAQGWSNPAFYKLATGTLGLQAGAQSSEVVALIMSQKALDSLMSNSFKMGGDVSVAAGPVGAGAGSQLNADMVVFSRAKGLYGGLNLDGTVVSIDEKGNQAYYGRPASPIDILVKHTVTSSYSNNLGRIASAPGGQSYGAPASGSSGEGKK
jgi:lipid-binding SYLF domain-containing protein